MGFEKGDNFEFLNKPLIYFYSCVLSYLAFE